MKETFGRSVIKGLSYRALGELVTFGTVYMVTGRLKVAATVSAMEILLKIGLYSGHERVWNNIPWGRDSSTESTKIREPVRQPASSQTQTAQTIKYPGNQPERVC